jgi:RNA polymerase sigma factor (sigma-70 family)
MAAEETTVSLLLRLRAKDPAAWREIDAVYRPMLIAYLQKQGLNQSEAADCVQDTFVKLLGRIESYDLPKSDIRKWLFNLAQETLTDHARLRAADKRAVEGWVARTLSTDTGDQLRMEAEWSAIYRKQILERAIAQVKARVTPRQWACFEQRILRDRPVDETARELGLEPNAVSVDALRVLKKIRAVCQEFDPDIRELPTASIKPEPPPSGAHAITRRGPDDSSVLSPEEIRAAREGPASASPTAPPAAGTGFTGALMDQLRRIGRAVKKSAAGAALPSEESIGDETGREGGPQAVGRVSASISRLARVSFPAQVVIGAPQSLNIQLVAHERAPREEIMGEPMGQHPGDWPMSFFVSYMSPLHAPTLEPPTIKIHVSVAAEHFAIDGTCRSEIVVPLGADSPPVQFRLRGLQVGPGRVMIDLSQRGRPSGSLDLTPEVVEYVEADQPSDAPPPIVATLIVNLDTAPIRPPPDLVIKVFEHRYANQAGRLQYVVSSALDQLGDLPLLDGDFGTIDLKTDVAAWVDDRLGALAALARQADATSEQVSATLARVGYNLFEQLLPKEFQELYWRIRGRSVRTILILSDEPHIPWELIKPYRENPATGEFEEGAFLGESYALTHWLRGRPPAHRFSLKRILAFVPQTRTAVEPRAAAKPVLDMVPLAAPMASEAGPSAERTAWLPISSDEELAMLRALEAFGSHFQLLPGRCAEILKAFEEGEFDLLHLVAHGEFAGSSAADASAVLMEDGLFRVGELSAKSALALSRVAPLIFFNSCHSGRLGFALTRLGSWGARFIHLGCGGFVGTLWPVTDQGAVAFAAAFYGEMSKGHPIGEAMLHSRHQVHAQYPDDPTWLAYCCYADPMARFELTGYR